MSKVTSWPARSVSIAGHLNRRIVNEQVLAARVREDETVPLGVVEPLDFAIGHAGIPPHTPSPKGFIAASAQPARWRAKKSGAVGNTCRAASPTRTVHTPAPRCQADVGGIKRSQPNTGATVGLGLPR